jgi:asparagine N-glycosylation enzyme membrane subunit Stt3
MQSEITFTEGAQMNSKVGFIFGTLSLATAVFFYSCTWKSSREIGRNIESSIEAGVPDSVSQTTWAGLIVSFSALCLAILAATMSSQFIRKRVINPWLNLITLAAPIAITGFIPLIGFYAVLFSVALGSAGIFAMRRKVSA